MVHRIKLYRVPFANTTGTHSSRFRPDQYNLVAGIPPPPVRKTPQTPSR